MKTRILIALTVVLIMALTAVVLAYNNTTDNQKTSASHCEMMKKHHASMTMDAVHNNDADCCKDNDCPMGGDCSKDDCPMDKDNCPMKNKNNCPMKNKDAQSSADTLDMQNVPVVAGDKKCCHKKV